MEFTIVTAYYPLIKSKFSDKKYYEWLKLFFQCVTCPVTFFCSSETYLNIKLIAKSNIKFVQRDFDSWDMMKEPQISKWRQWHITDPENKIHSPELYAIWAAKQEFIREAIKLQEAKYYIWCDAGFFRSLRNGSFLNVSRFIEPGKITCLDVTDLCKDYCNLNNIPKEYRNLIGGGILAGDKDAWLEFSKNYLEELQRNIHGIDQVIFHRILNETNSIIINPSIRYGDPWFFLSSLFSENVKFLTVDLMGGLGNQLFQLAFLLYASKISGNWLFLQNLNSPSTGHSSEQYFETLLQKWKPNYSQKSINITLNENPKLAYENWETKINSQEGNIKLHGYFQRYEYIDLVRDEFISRLTFDETILQKYHDIGNKFFIHVRGGDYKGNKFHDVNLEQYYLDCIQKHPEEQFIIFTNDIPYAKTHLPNIPIIEESELDTLYLMSKAKGCVCANSSFSWWGAYLNPNRPIYFPDEWFNDSSMDTSGFYFKGSQKIQKFIPPNIHKQGFQSRPIIRVNPTMPSFSGGKFKFR